MKIGGGHFAPKLGGQFELESGGHFKLELGGQYHWNLQPKEPIQVNLGNNHFFSRKTIENLCRESLFIFNNNCDIKLSEETLVKIYKALL